MEALIAAIVVCLVVIATEATRFAIARLTGGPLERYQVGFGPTIWSRKIIEVRALPLGGAAHTRRWWARLLTIVVGPLVMYAWIALLAFVLMTCQGIPTGESSIARITAGAAVEGKLVAGDRILAVDGVPLRGGAPQLTRHVNDREGAPVTLSIRRGGETRDIVVAAKLEPRAQRWVLGVFLEPVRSTDAGPALRAGLRYPRDQLVVIVDGVRELAAGHDEADTGGPVRIVEEFSATAMPSWVIMLQLALIFASWVLLALILIDGGRVIAFAIGLARRQ